MTNTKQNIERIRFAHRVQGVMIAFVLFCVYVFFPFQAHADCVNPSGVRGQQVYNGTHKVMQYCDGTTWYSMAAGLSSTIGDLTCADTEVVYWHSGDSEWKCGPDQGMDNLGNHTATQDIDAATNDIVNVGLMEFENVTGAAAPRSAVGGGSGGSGTAGCYLPWGGSVPHGVDVTAYQSNTSNCGTTETRTCSDGTLSGSYEHQSCSTVLDIASFFSTDLYTGNGATQAITNGVDLAAQGGLVWMKTRNSTKDHILIDSERGLDQSLSTEKPNSQGDIGNPITFNSNGYTLSDSSDINQNGSINWVGWTFRKAPKFFDVVTYTGTGSVRTIPHNLGIEPGLIIVKRLTGGNSAWMTYHRSLGSNQYIEIGNGNANTYPVWNNTAPTTTEFSLGTDTTVNANGDQFVAYLFAHDSSTDGGVQCGSYSGTPGFEKTVNLGWTPQFILLKKSSSTGPWNIYDTVRGVVTGAGDKVLVANTNSAEVNSTGTDNAIRLESNGFSLITSGSNTNASGTYIYCAIREE